MTTGALEAFSTGTDLAQGTVTTGGTTAPASGTSESWTVNVTAAFPVASASAVSVFHAADLNLPGEVFLVITCPGGTGSAQSWTVIRGADGTAPVAHASGFTVVQVASSGWLGTVAGTLLPAQTVQTSNFTISQPGFYPVDASGGNVTVQLPTAPADGFRCAVKMINTSQLSGYTVAVQRGGTDCFNSSAFTSPRTLFLLNQAILLQYSGNLGGWYVMNDDLPLTQLQQTLPSWTNVKYYGATGNGKLVTDASISASGTTLTSSSASFTSGDVGKIGVLMGAGALNGSVGVPLPFTISAYISATQVTISATATTAVSSATCYYGTDDKSAIQQAIAQCPTGGTVYLPNAIYLCSANLSITKAMRLTGDGATLVWTNSAGIDFGNTYISAASGGSTTIGLEIDHLILDGSGGHLLQNFNLNKFTWHDLRLVQRSYNYAIAYSTNSSANQLDGYCYNIISRVNGAPRSVQSWYVLSSIGGGMAMCKWQNCLWQNNDGDTTQYYVEFDCTGTHNYTNDVVFDMCWFDRAFGGCIKLLSCQSASFRSCNIIDSYSQTINGGTVQWGSNHGYYIGAYSGGSNWPSQKISFHDCSRDLQGPNGSSSYDIYLEATTDCVTISSYEVRDIPGTSVFYPYFNFNGCTDVIVMNCPDAVITNSASSQVSLGPSGNIGFTGSLTGATQPPVPLPSDAGYISWTFDPVMVAGSQVLGTSGVLYVMAVFIRAATSTSTITVAVTATGGTLTSGENFVGLFQNNGTLLQSSADQSSVWTSTGVKNASITAQALSAGWYWVGLLINYSASGTAFARAGSQTAGSPLVANAGSSGGSRRFGQISSFGTSLASFSTASLADPGITLWAAVK